MRYPIFVFSNKFVFIFVEIDNYTSLIFFWHRLYISDLQYI